MNFKLVVRTLFVSVLVVVFLVSVKTVSAQNYASPSTLRDLKTENSCTGITTKITNQINLWNTNEPKKVQLYSDWVARIQATVTFLQDKGYDTSKVLTALEDLNKAILLRHTDATTLINDLKNTQQFACGSSQGQFRNAVLTARSQYTVVRNDTINIHKVWLNEVRPAIVALRSQNLVSPTPSGQ